MNLRMQVRALPPKPPPRNRAWRDQRAAELRGSVQNPAGKERESRRNGLVATFVNAALAAFAEDSSKRKLALLRAVLKGRPADHKEPLAALGPRSVRDYSTHQPSTSLRSATPSPCIPESAASLFETPV